MVRGEFAPKRGTQPPKVRSSFLSGGAGWRTKDQTEANKRNAATQNEIDVRSGQVIVKSQWIVITDCDMERLSRLIRGAPHSLSRDQEQLDLLDHVLQTADVRPPGRMPKSVVRMNSKVYVGDLGTRKEEVYTVVFPGEANASRGLVSVLAPVGIALIGHRKGSVVEVKVPGGIRRLRIRHVIQSPGSSPRKEPPEGRHMTPPNFLGKEVIAA